ncbi:MAG: SRPBCC family protein [Planctomycetota bacterium]
MKKLIVRALILVALAGLGILIYGMTVPTRHRAASMARFQQTREDLWAVLADFPGQAEWRADVDRVERLPDEGDQPVWMFHTGRQGFPFVVTESIEPRLLTVTTPRDADLPFGGSWTWQISAAEGANVVTIIEDGEIFNPFFRGLTSLFFGYHATMDDYLRELGRKFGEDVTPMPVPQAVPVP